jgi:hypothetical protein
VSMVTGASIPMPLFFALRLFLVRENEFSPARFFHPCCGDEEMLSGLSAAGESSLICLEELFAKSGPLISSLFPAYVPLVSGFTLASPATSRSFLRSLAVSLILLVATILTAGVVVYVRSDGMTQVHRLVPAAAPLPPPSSSDVMILAGSSARNYTDQLGHVWSPDRFFDGGESWPVRYRRILRTDDPRSSSS